MSSNKEYQGGAVLRSIDFARELENLRRLLNDTFRPVDSRPGDMIAEYPTLVCESNRDNVRVVATASHQVLSHVGTAFRTTCWSGLFTCTAALIGAVATASEARSQGYATDLVLDAIQRAKARDAWIMFISGDRSLYTRLGAAPVFTFPTARIQSEGLLHCASQSDGVLRKATHDDLRAIERLRGMSGTRFVLPAPELAALLDCKFAGNQPAEWFVLQRPQDQRLVSWVVVNLIRDGAAGTTVLRVVEHAGSLDVLPAFIGKLLVEVPEYGSADIVEYQANDAHGIPAAWLPLVSEQTLHCTVLLLKIGSFLNAYLAPVLPAALKFVADEDEHAVEFFLEEHGSDQVVSSRFVGNQVEFLCFRGPSAVSLSSQSLLYPILNDLFPLPFLRYGLSFI